MRALPSNLVALTVAACGTGPGRIARAPALPASCAVEDGKPYSPVVDYRGATLYRVHLATRSVTRIDSAHALLGQDPVAVSVEDGRLRVRSRQGLGPTAIDADARGANQIAWQDVRDGMLFFSLYNQGLETFQAVQLAAAPHLQTAWCRIGKDDPPGNGSHAYMTAGGPLLVDTHHDLVALDEHDGDVLWKVPWRDRAAPVTEIDAGATLVVCESQVVAIDRASGAVRWTRDAPVDVATDCQLGGDAVVVSPRRCASTGCTPLETMTLDVATGHQLAALPAQPRVLQVIDRDHVLLDTETGVAILDTRHGVISESIALPGDFFRAEQVSGGDVLISGRGTARLALSPLAVRWSVPEAYAVRAGDALVAASSEPRRGESSLILIDVTCGAKTTIALPTMAPSAGELPFELGGATIIGSSQYDVDVAVSFSYYD